MITSAKGPVRRAKTRGSSGGVDPAAKAALAAVEAGRDLALGDGLVLRAGAVAVGFVLRFTSPETGKRREIGCGGLDGSSVAAASESLAHARSQAMKCRGQIEAGVDPLEIRAHKRAEKKAAKVTAARERNTLAEVAKRAHKAIGNIKAWRNERHREEWLDSMERHCGAKLWATPIDSIGTAELRPVLDSLTNDEKHETARRVRQRLEAVFDDAIEHGIYTRANPAAMLRRKVRAAPRRDDNGNHHSALPYSQLPAFMARLREMPGHAARCLEFTILTATRTRESLGARWSEIDTDARTWTVPADRMKAGREHTVHLSDAALRVLETQRGHSAVWVFPSPQPGRDAPLSNMAMLVTLQRMGLWGADVPAEKRITVHGFRASFSTWAAETGAAPFEVREAALAHVVETTRGKVAGAYDRSEHLEARRQLLVAWAAFIEGGVK